MAAGSIVIDLLMKTGSFETDTKRAEKRLREMQKTAKQVGVVIGTAMAAVGTGLAVMVKSAIDSADAMRDLSIRVGVSTEVLSAYGYAASQTGTDIETLAKGLKVLSKNAADSLNPTSEQAKVFDALGITVTDATGKLKGLDQLIPEIADKFKALEDGTTKAALAQALFGKAGLELTEFLNQGGDGLAEFTAKARELGIVVDGQTAAAADEFNDTLGDLKAQVSGMGLSIARELLPQLKESAADLSDLARTSNLASDAASVLGAAIGAGVSILSGYSKAVNFVSVSIEAYIRQLEGAIEVQKNFLTLGFADGGVADGIQKVVNARRDALAQLAALNNPKKPGPALTFAGEGAEPAGLFQRPASQAADSDLERRLGRALSNPAAAKAKGGKSGLSDAERDAQRLKAAYDSLVASQREQIALFGKTDEAAKVRYATEYGELSKLAPELKAVAIANAERLDQLQAEADFEEERSRAEQARAESVARVLADLKAERDQLGMTNEERARYNALLAAGPNLLDADRQAISESVHALYEQGRAMDDLISLQDQWRTSLSDAITDVATGAKSLKEAFTDFFDDFAARVTEMIAKRWIEQLFGEQGSNGGGSAGGWFSSLLGAFFGGAKAGGGDVMSNQAYLVGEQGPEMFVPRTAGAILPAGETRGLIAGGRGMTQNNHFHYAAPPEPRTQMQTANRVGFELKRASRNN